MAIKASYNGINGCTVKILHISGSSASGWKAVASILPNTPINDPITSFEIHVPFVDGQNPYDAVYSEIGKLSLFSSVEHDVKTTLNAETIDTLRAAEAAKVANETSKGEKPKPKARKKKQV